MAIEIAGDFEGPYSSTASLRNLGGVYAILTPTVSNQYKLLDVGESGDVKYRVENHDRAACWPRNANSGGIFYAVRYTPGLSADERRKIELAIRAKFDPPCGKV